MHYGGFIDMSTFTIDFLKGAGSILNIQPEKKPIEIKHRPKMPKRSSDRLSLEKDLEKIELDIYRALSKVQIDIEPEKIREIRGKINGKIEPEIRGRATGHIKPRLQHKKSE